MIQILKRFKKKDPDALRDLWAQYGRCAAQKQLCEIELKEIAEKINALSKSTQKRT